MVDVVTESPGEVHAKLCRVLREATIRQVGVFVWKEIVDPVAEGLTPHALAHVRGLDNWSALMPSLGTEPDQLHVMRINFVDGQDNSGFVGWLATLLKAELGTGVTVVCGFESAHGGVFDYWCIPNAVSKDAAALLKRWQATGPPDTNTPATAAPKGSGGRPWIRLPIPVETDDARLLIREARASDVEAIVGLIARDSLREAVVGGDDQSGEDERHRGALARLNQDPNNLQLVLVLDGQGDGDGDEIVGCLQVTRIPGLFRNGESRVHLEAIRIAPHHRGRSLGSRLLRAVIDRIADPSVHVVQLMSDHRRTDAARFYERLGFVGSHRGFKMRIRKPEVVKAVGASGSDF